MRILDVKQGTPEWLDARRCVITGTRLAAVMGGKEARKTLMIELIAELIAPPEESYKSQAMEMGNIGEEIIKEDYPDYVSVGLILGDEDWIGISPDAVMKDINKYLLSNPPIPVVTIDKALEIKSPEPKSFIRYALDGGIPKQYYWQVVHYFVVIPTLQELDFVIYCPQIGIKRVVHVTRAELQEDVDKAKESLQEFRKEWLSALSKLKEET